MLSGKEATTLDVNGGEISVMVEYPDGEYDTIDQVKGIVLDTATGGSVALTDIADIYFKDSPQNIVRADKEYQVTITGDFVKGIAKDDQDAIETTIYKEAVLPNMSESITRLRIVWMKRWLKSSAHLRSNRPCRLPDLRSYGCPV